MSKDFGTKATNLSDESPTKTSERNDGLNKTFLS